MHSNHQKGKPWQLREHRFFVLTFSKISLQLNGHLLMALMASAAVVHDVSQSIEAPPSYSTPYHPPTMSTPPTLNDIYGGHAPDVAGGTTSQKRPVRLPAWVLMMICSIVVLGRNVLSRCLYRSGKMGHCFGFPIAHSFPLCHCGISRSSHENCLYGRTTRGSSFALFARLLDCWIANHNGSQSNSGSRIIR